MARTTDLVCIDCKTAIWIGRRDEIFIHDPEVMKTLEKFLIKHENHNLKFVEDQLHDYLTENMP
jgi:hypothetical protein